MLDLNMSLIFEEIKFPFMLTSLGRTRIIHCPEEILSEEMYAEVELIEPTEGGLCEVFLKDVEVISNAITERMRNYKGRTDYAIIEYIHKHFDTSDEIVKAVLRGFAL